MSENSDNLFENTEQDQLNALQKQVDANEEQVDSSVGEAMTEDNDLFELKQRVKGMDEEAARLIQLQTEMEQQMKSTQSPSSSKFLVTL